jgi:hypothetical protein|tara:strand:+ start:1084 stop:1224 length:141 start_codon:yes stop_codon:yes gene_type:complete
MEWNMEQINEAVDCLMELKELELKRVSLEVEIAKLTKDMQTMENSK